MAVNTVNEMAQDDPVIRRVLHTSMSEIMGMMTALIRRGQESGEFRTDVDAESLSEYVGTINAGFATHGKGEFPSSGSTDVVEIAMSALATK